MRSLVGFSWFSLIRAENQSKFVMLDLKLFYKRCKKFWEPLREIWTGSKTRSVGSFRLGLQEKAVCVVWLVLVVSHSSELRINHHLSCWIPDFLRKVLKFFEIFSQLSGLIGKPNQLVHWVRFSRTTV